MRFNDKIAYDVACAATLLAPVGRVLAQGYEVVMISGARALVHRDAAGTMRQITGPTPDVAALRAFVRSISEGLDLELRGLILDAPRSAADNGAIWDTVGKMLGTPSGPIADA